MRLMDKDCWERGCACHDDRIDKASVAIVKQRTWVGLTDQEIRDTYEWGRGQSEIDRCRAIEAKLKEKNT